MNPSPDDRSFVALSDGLNTRVVGCNILYYPRLSSTMDVAREQARLSAPEGTVVMADEQMAGRGRLKRSWIAPAGNIALSVLLYPPMTAIPSLIMLASLGVVQAIEAVADLKADIKWPNDILVNGKKVSGILIETDARSSAEGRAGYAIIGIGINVNLSPSDFHEIESTATSLSLESNQTPTRVEIIRRLLNELDSLYLTLRAGGSLFEGWRDRLITLGKPVRVTSTGDGFDGLAESVDRDGSLFVRRQDGLLTRVVAGDVTLRG